MRTLPCHRSAILSRLCEISKVFQGLTLLILSLSLLSTACAPQSSPDLLQLDSVGPKTLEAGSEIRIVGSGFPENHPGSVIFEGTAYAPARAPERVRWEFPLHATSRGLVTIRLKQRALQDKLKGASHVTFRGDALIEFAPIIEGRPTLRGSKKDLVLDLFSSAGSKAEAPQLFQEYIGLEISDRLVVSDITRGGLAAQAGLQTGDHLRSLDSVRLDTIRDFLPQARARTSVIEYTRQGYSGVAQAQIDRANFQVLDHAIAARALAVGAAIVLTLIAAARPPRFVLWLVGAATRARRKPVTWIPDVGSTLQGLAFPLFFGAILLLWWLLGHPQNFLGETSFLGSLALGALLLFVSSFLLGGVKSKRHGFSLLGAGSSTFSRMLIFLPILIAAVSRAGEVGSLRLGEIAERQGAWPNEWGLFASPWTFVLGVSYLVALLPISGRRAPLEGQAGAQTRGATAARVCEWTGQLVLLGLWVLLFGGAARGAQLGELLAGGLLLVKVASVTQLLSWARARTGLIRLGESWALFGWCNLGVSLTTALVSVGLSLLGISERHGEVLGLFAASLACSALILIAVTSQRSWTHMGRRIDPWI